MHPSIRPSEQHVETGPNTNTFKKDLVSSTHPPGPAVGDLPYNEQVPKFSSIPDLIHSPVETVNVFIECNAS